jgi:hypothetical protein
VITVDDVALAGAVGRLAEFRDEYYRCLTARADAFELEDALLWGDFGDAAAGGADPGR